MLTLFDVYIIIFIGTFDPKDKDNSSLAIFTGIGDTIDTLMEPLPKMWDDIAELLKFSACWPSDN